MPIQKNNPVGLLLAEINIISNQPVYWIPFILSELISDCHMLHLIHLDIYYYKKII